MKVISRAGAVLTLLSMLTFGTAGAADADEVNRVDINTASVGELGHVRSAANDFMLCFAVEHSDEHELVALRMRGFGAHLGNHDAGKVRALLFDRFDLQACLRDAMGHLVDIGLDGTELLQPTE